MSDRRRRIVLAIGLVASLAIALVAATLAYFYYGLHCTSGDGGAPYVAGSSPQKGVCDATADGTVLVIAFLAAVVAVPIVAWRTGRGWAGGRGSALPAVLLLSALPLLPLVSVGLADLPSDRCSAEQEAAYAAWLDRGGHGESPYECETY